MNDEINAMTCPKCAFYQRLEFPFLCTNVMRHFALWYEPYHDPQIDKDIADYRKHMGPDSFYAKAPRIKDWESFKKTLREMEMAAPLQAQEPVYSPEMRKNMAEFISDIAKENKREQKAHDNKSGMMDLTHYKQFWRGEFSLGQAFWIMYFGINFALGFAVLFLMLVVSSILKSDMLVSTIYFGGVIIIAVYTLWASVGMWRCSPVRGKDGKRPMFWPLLVKVIIVLSSISAISKLIDRRKHPEEMGTSADPQKSRATGR